MRSIKSLLRMLTAFALLLALQNVYTDDTKMPNADKIEKRRTMRQEQRREDNKARRAERKAKRDAHKSTSATVTQEHAMPAETPAHEGHTMMHDESSSQETVTEDATAEME
jgi:hypothetical protein